MANDDKQKQADIVIPKKSLVSSIVPILLVTIVAGGGGFLQGTMFRNISSNPLEPVKPGATASEGDQIRSDGAKTEVPASKTAIVRSLTPIISNLGTPSDTWMRLELSLLMDQAAQSEQDIVAVKAADSVVNYLRTVELKKIEGPSGFLHFREDLSDMLVAEFAGKITGVLIGSMVVE